MNVLEVDNISKHIGGRPIIRSISFNIKEGEIFGFLGPNGAGKTTTIRMLTGLIHPNEGKIKIMGHDLKKEREKALSYVGAVIENPELYNYLSGRENLMQICRIRKISKAKLEEIIHLVNLENKINQKVKKYSLGMKQRLGLAASLLSNPKLLILDEPTNGLDPNGILQFRDIIRTVTKEYKTSVFISSHILSEVEQICSKVAFINKGILQCIESIDNIDYIVEKETFILIPKDINLAKTLLPNIDLIHHYKVIDNKIYIEIDKNSSYRVIKELVEVNVDIKEFYKEHKVLEERYMELMEGGQL
ncbi:ABC transporter ATP-binding protein [Clostridium cochlearium]|uniref:ABC transporter ATP-binding protein n=1 Tax=Clostridium cochlearium TaxID=1494 RepID=UPI0015714822|nr:ABC transporter ATP-binding protein [Clostridium cochlearium]MBV1821084.1 ABC transporter ATP-binding protein [Bacteroidales bacterium MSK.15.36]MCG4570928.1 ABC transporter ATP-binding protein [Clostridium cochlearium]MCG4580411.1 ABC transporter ATP-binding protein [Clostridium cochlearium]NSJ92363.1 ABC transporter ATP-binding protein [Coprococcus sp. MSK.21.13]